MKNKILKVLLIILILVVFSFIFENSIFADGDFDFKIFNGISAGRAGDTVTNVMGALVDIVAIIAAGVAIIMLIVIGVKYTTASASGKAEVKKDITGYVTGAVILFATSGILKLLQMFIDGNINIIA